MRTAGLGVRAPRLLVAGLHADPPHAPAVREPCCRPSERPGGLTCWRPSLWPAPGCSEPVPRWPVPPRKAWSPPARHTWLPPLAEGPCPGRPLTPVQVWCPRTGRVPPGSWGAGPGGHPRDWTRTRCTSALPLPRDGPRGSPVSPGYVCAVGWAGGRTRGEVAAEGGPGSLWPSPAPAPSPARSCPGDSAPSSPGKRACWRHRIFRKKYGSAPCLTSLSRIVPLLHAPLPASVPGARVTADAADSARALWRRGSPGGSCFPRSPGGPGRRTVCALAALGARGVGGAVLSQDGGEGVRRMCRALRLVWFARHMSLGRGVA